MKCQICDYKPRPYRKGVIGESLYTISWDSVDTKEYEARKRDGRTTNLQVCPGCYERYTGQEAESVGQQLAKLNKQRGQ